MFLNINAAEYRYFGTDYSDVDSIEIFSIDLNAIGTIGKFSFNRNKIEDIYQYRKNIPVLSKSCIHILFKRRREVMLVMSLLQNLTPLDSSKVDIKPSEVYYEEDSERWWRAYGNGDNNDPIETRGKIIIHYNNGTKVSGYFSQYYIDIYDWRYTNDSFLNMLRSFNNNSDLDE